MPPGPRGLPVVGNALQIPRENLAQVFGEMSARYGDVMRLDIFGQPVVILGTQETALELLEKRSALYSDRLPSVMTDLTGWGFVFASLSYGPQWRQKRKMLAPHLTPAATRRYQLTQVREAHRFALRLMQDPKNFLHYIRAVFVSIMMPLIYGIEAEGSDNKYIRIAGDAIAIINHLAIPGKYLVETFPVLRFLPSWFPGAKFKRDAKIWKSIVLRLRDVPWEDNLARIRDGTAVPSIMTALLHDVPEPGSLEAVDKEETARDVAASAAAGGADTTTSAVQAFFLAMASHPDAQRQAQAELDTIVGPHRLPDFSDRESLPYVCALIKECLRWRAVDPLGLPHRSVQDDEFRGYFIPKGTVVIANPWAYSRDPKHYPEPEAFRPERFLKDGKLDLGVLDPADYVFGYGRRICPGRHLSDASLFILAATVLHTLSISAPLDACGKPIKLEGKMTNGAISYPEPFDVDIKPRAPWAEALVRESCGAESA